MSLIFLPALMLAAGADQAAPQQDEKAPIETIEVHGRGLDLIGEAEAASEGVVGYADFKDRPLSRTGELVEVIPGAVATQHSGEGKANQYFLRGFNLDHGTDFSAYVDGVPVNLRTHGHGQGYLDLNFIIPEVVERVDYRKGPYSPDSGDFSSAGSARYSTYDRLDRDFVELAIGENGYRRIVGAVDVDVAKNTSLMLAAEGQRYDGPWDLEQDLEKINLLAKLTHDSPSLRYEVTASAYDNKWRSTDQIPLRATENGLIERFGAIDEDLGGDTSRYALSGTVNLMHDNGATTDIAAYVVTYDLNLWSNFTYFLDDPVNGDEFEQEDERTYFGGSLRHTRALNNKLRLKAGTEVRFDDIGDIGLYRSAGRERLSTVRRDTVEELSLAAWGALETDLTETLRVRAGLRADYYDADVTAISHPVNGGTADDTMLSPSFSIAWRATDTIEFYANYGEGFHSNDVRGATISIDPATGDPADTVPILVRSRGAEIGARFETERFKATVTGFWLELDSELVFVGDAGTTEANDASRRTGVEASMFWKPTNWLVLDASAAHTDAEFDIPGSATDIPGAVGTVFSAGVIGYAGPVTLSARLRHFGSAPLVEDGSVKSEATSIVNMGASYEYGPMTLRLELLNALNAEETDISYYFESQLPGEAAAVEDLHFHPVEPRQVRASIRYSF